MKKLTLIAIAALIAGQISLKTATRGAQAPVQTGAIRGKVVREGTREPISEVQIFLNGPSGPSAAPVVTPFATGGVVVVNGVAVAATVPGAPTANKPAAVTDSGGTFEIRDVPAGKQVVTASREGYFGTSRVAVQPSVQENTTVTAGKTTEVTFVLVPAGIIAGRVTSINGENASDVAVQALRLSYQDANPILQSVGTRVTDDRGEYRLFKLPPGQYYVVAGQVGGGPGGGRGGVRGTGGAPPPPPPPIDSPNPSVRTFYPDTTEASQAIAVPVRGGDENGGINIRVQPLSGTRKISGQVTTTIPLADMGPSARQRASQDAAGGAPGQVGVRNPPADVVGGVVQILAEGGRGSNSQITLYPRSKGGPQDPAGGVSTPLILVEPQNGRFELPNIPRGTYDLFASVPDVKGYGPASPPGLAASPLAYGRTVVEVGDRDVDGVRVIVHSGVDLKGRILVDGAPSSAASNVKVSMQVDDSASRIVNYQQIGRFQPAIDADGSFMIPAVSEALYRFQVTLGAAPAASQSGVALPGSALNANAYVADITEGGTSVYDNGISVGDRPLGSIEIFIRTDGGGIEGFVRGANQMPAGGATVVVVPSQSHRSNPMFYKTTTSDPMGRFSVRGVAPGEYRIFAWSNPPGTAYRNADFMKKYEGRGATVNVVAGARLSSTTVDLIVDE